MASHAVERVDLSGEVWVVDGDSYPSQPEIHRQCERKPYGVAIAVVPQRSGHPLEPHPVTDAAARLIVNAPEMLRILLGWEARFEGCDADNYGGELRKLIVATREVLGKVEGRGE